MTDLLKRHQNLVISAQHKLGIKLEDREHELYSRSCWQLIVDNSQLSSELLLTLYVDKLKGFINIMNSPYLEWKDEGPTEP